MDRYFANLLSVSIISIGSLSCALQEGDTGESDKTLLFLRDAFATADALLRRADREDMCEFLSEPNMLKLRSNKNGDFAQALATVVAKVNRDKMTLKTKIIKIMDQYVISGDPGQRCTSVRSQSKSLGVSRRRRGRTGCT